MNQPEPVDIDALLLEWETVSESDHALIAEIVGWFDLVAVQEVNDDFTGLQGVLARLPKNYRAVFSDAGGSDERLTFITTPPSSTWGRRSARLRQRLPSTATSKSSSRDSTAAG